MDTQTWYMELTKPAWAPPSFVFGPVWTVLYIIIALTYGTVIYKVLRGEWPMILLVPFGLNLFFNLIFSPIQFGLQNNLLASIDILLILTTLIWALITIFPFAKWVAFANIPYLLWVSFATVLQFTITYLNWDR